MTKHIGRLALLWRGDREARSCAKPEASRLHRVFEALASRNIHAEPAVYSDDMVDEVRAQLQDLDGVLVWVDPLADGQNRTKLDAIKFCVSHSRRGSRRNRTSCADPADVSAYGTGDAVNATGDRAKSHRRSRPTPPSDVFGYFAFRRLNRFVPRILKGGHPGFRSEAPRGRDGRASRTRHPCASRSRSGIFPCHYSDQRLPVAPR